MKKFFLFLFSFLVFLPRLAYAHCPLCTGAMVAGVATTRYFGVDDGIVGIFVGGAIISMALWFNRSNLKKKYVPLNNLFVLAVIWVLTVGSFYLAGLFKDGALVLGMSGLLFGILLGSVLTYIGPLLSGYIKKKNLGKVLFPFQAIAITLLLLVLASTISYLVI